MADPKRVLFLERNLRNEKLGVMYLSAALKNRGHHADLIQTDKENLDERIRDYRPDFIAFSVTTGEHLYALNMARTIRKRYDIPSILGGPHCTYFPEIGFEDGVDFTVQGQGERAIVDIVEGRLAPGFHKTPMVHHLDELHFPDRDIFYQYPEFRDNPMKNVITSRACPYKCSYCFNHSQLALARIDGETRQWFDRRSVDNVVTEINNLRDRYPIEKVLFIDDSFIQSRSWLDTFLDGYTRDVRLPWMCSLRVNCLDEELAERMFRSGLEMVNYAMESADPEVQQRLLHRGHITNGDVIRAIALFNRFGVRARMQNMIGLPLLNPLEDALNTLQFNLRHRVTDSWCSIFQPYPRTALGQYCVDHGLATPDQLRHCSESFFDESRLNIPEKKELYALQKLWYFVIDGQIPLDIVRILIRGEFTPAIGDALQRLRFQCSRRKLYAIDDAKPSASVDADRAVNLQSRERLLSRNRTLEPRASARADSPTASSSWMVTQQTMVTMGNPIGDSSASCASLISSALRNSPLPPEFFEIMTGVRFAPSDLHALTAHLRGDPTGPPILYTVNDETGELADPEVSIYRRGVPDPDACDIRQMPEDHFMRGMVETRTALASRRPDINLPMKTTPLDPDPAFTLIGIAADGGPVANEGFIPTATSDADERHLNQYLA